MTAFMAQVKQLPEFHPSAWKDSFLKSFSVLVFSLLLEEDVARLIHWLPFMLLLVRDFPHCPFLFLTILRIFQRFLHIKIVKKDQHYHFMYIFSGLSGQCT